MYERYGIGNPIIFDYTLPAEMGLNSNRLYEPYSAADQHQRLLISDSLRDFKNKLNNATDKKLIKLSSRLNRLFGEDLSDIGDFYEKMIQPAHQLLKPKCRYKSKKIAAAVLMVGLFTSWITMMTGQANGILSNPR